MTVPFSLHSRVIVTAVQIELHDRTTFLFLSVPTANDMGMQVELHGRATSLLHEVFIFFVFSWVFLKPFHFASLLHLFSLISPQIQHPTIITNIIRISPQNHDL